MSFAARTDTLKLEGAYEVLARAQALESEGHSLIHLEIGEPDFPTPANICLAGVEAIASGRTRYNPPAGLPSLREVIAASAGDRRGIRVRASQVVVSPGAKPNLFFPTLALVEPGDEVIYPDPGFPTYRAMIEVAGGTPVPVPLEEESGFSFDLDRFDHAVSDRTRLIILNSPSNPTGGVLPRPDLEHIAAAAQKHDAWVLSDEIYAQIVFDGLSVPSIAAIDGMLDRTIVLDGFSKTYAMTGWRIGYALMPEALAARVSLLLNHSVGCTAHFTQLAGIEALTGPQEAVAGMVAKYQARRDLLVAGLNDLPGVHCLRPQGAFYAFPNIRETGLGSREFAEAMLQGGVALLPGTAFGQFGEGYVRLSYANSQENLRRALERMQAILRRRLV
jgi:aspartate aminotransferase